MSAPAPVTTDTFTDAQGRRYIAGQEVHEDVWRRFGEAQRQVGELQSILIDNTHELRTLLHGSSSAMPCTPKQAWEQTVQELRERLGEQP